MEEGVGCPPMGTVILQHILSSSTIACLKTGAISTLSRVDLRLFTLFERAGLPCRESLSRSVNQIGAQAGKLVFWYYFSKSIGSTQAKRISVSELGDISHSPLAGQALRTDTNCCSGFQHVRSAPGHSTRSTWHNMMRRKSSRTRHRQQEFVFQF